MRASATGSEHRMMLCCGGNRDGLLTATVVPSFISTVKARSCNTEHHSGGERMVYSHPDRAQLEQ